MGTGQAGGPDEAGRITRLLRQIDDGDEDAWGELTPLVYQRLRAQARRQLRGESSPRALDTTALVHEAFLRLADQSRVGWRDRSQFFAVAATVMRRILIDEARRRNADKRGGDRTKVPLEDAEVGRVDLARPEALVALDRALERLEAMDERQCRVVECRYFAGLTIEETASALGLSAATVKRDWRSARAWLYRELADGDGPAGGDEEPGDEAGRPPGDGPDAGPGGTGDGGS